MSVPWIRVSAPESAVREEIANAVGSVMRPSLECTPLPDEAAIVDAVLAAIVGAPVPDRAGLLLECIKAESGQWTGQRAARALYARFGWDSTPERCVQLMRRLVGRGQLVVANPPRGATFVLPFGPGGEVRHEWATAVGGRRDPEQLDPTTEPMARARMQFPWHTALVRREVNYGPWVEVDPGESESTEKESG